MAALILLLLLPSAASATALPATIKENTTLSPAGNPYTGASTIETGVTLIVEPGVKFSNLALTVKGTLNAEGTASEPIVVTESSGNFNAITFEPGSGASVLDHLEVTKCGSGFYVKAPIRINKSSPTIKNSTFANNESRTIWTEAGSPQIADNHFSLGKSSATAIYYGAYAGQTGDVNIHGNYAEGGTSTAIEVSAAASSITATTLGGNTVVGNEAGASFSFSAPEIPGDITENTLSGNKSNLLTVSGTVAKSSTWKNGGTRILIGSGVTIAAGVELKMAPGLYFKRPQFIVKGTLVAEGTSESPIVFTEMGNENFNAITFEPGSGASVLDHLEVTKCGSGFYTTSPIRINKSSPTVKNSTFSSNEARTISVPDGGAPEIANNHFSMGKISSAAIYYGAGEGKTGDINVHGNYVEGGTNIAIEVSAAKSSVTATALSGNTVVGNEGAASFSFSAPEIPGDITENTLSGNKSNQLMVSGTVAKSSTWKNGGTRVSIGSGVTIAAGVELKMAPGLYFKRPQFIVKGTLVAEGTAGEPIIFTEAANENFNAITFEPGSGASVLDHLEVTKCGSGFYVKAPIRINKSSPTIKNSTFANNESRTIWTEAGSPQIADNHFSLGKSSATAIYYGAYAGQTGDVNIHGNYAEGGTSTAIEVSAAASSITATTLGGNTVVGNEAGASFSFSAPEIPGDITENTLSGNKANLLTVSGTVAKSSTWKNGGTRIRPSNVTVASGVTLAIAKGVLMVNPGFTVKGTLKAEGTASEPVVFTGLKEEKTGEWESIKFEPASGESVLDHTEVAYGGSGSGIGMVEAKGSHPTITNSTIRKSSNSGIKVTESGAPKIEWNRFRGNSSGISYSGTGKLAAPHNDWGCASGPSPAGCGNSVTSNVEWKPSVQLEELAGHCRGQESQCREGADPISLATGQLSYSHRDLLLTNKGGMPLEFTRAYSSGSSADTGLGLGWSQTGLASATEFASGEVLIVRSDGRQDLFSKTEGGYKAPSGVTDVLTMVEGTFQLTTLENTVYRFDASGRIASITDDHNLKTTYAYSAEGRLTTITDPSSQTLTFSYNGSNHITLVKDSTGREVKFGYSVAGDLATVTDALSGVTEYTYDSEHRLKTIKDPRGNVILKNTFDGQGRIIEQRDGLENLWKLAYKENETIVTEPEGGKITYNFDGQDRVIAEKDQLGHTTTTSYDEAGNVDEIVRPGGAKWQFGHDANGNLTSVIDPEEGERSYEYDGKNRLTSFTDEREEAWAYEWSEANDLKKITDPAEGETTFTYNASGQPLTATDPNKHTTTFTYDTRGNRLTAKDALEHTTVFGYDSRGYLTSMTAPGLKAEAFERNALGDLLVRTTPMGNKTKYAYDANGVPKQITDPAENVWKIELNAMERPTAYVDPLGKETKIEYDGNFNPVKVTDRRGKPTTYAYDLANQLTGVERPEGGDWEFGYDARGNWIEAVDPRENATTYEYDLLDHMTEAAEPLEATTSYEYDPAGNLTSFTDPRENTTDLVYDELSRLTELKQPLGRMTSFGYDDDGNRISRTTAEGTVDFDYDAANRLEGISEGETTLRAYDYDAANRMIGATDAQADEIKIGYDEDSRVASINDGRGQTITRKFDSRGNVTQQTDGRGTLKYEFDKLSRMIALTDPQSKVLDFEYDPEGDLTKVELPNGVLTTNEYDDAGRLAETISAKGETTLESLDYEYDTFGNRIGKVDRLSQETTYEYDALNRLIEFDPPGEGSAGYDYDPAGNRTEAGGITYSFNALNQLTSASNGTTYDYDGVGRLIETDQGEANTTYDWSPLDELTGVGTGGQEIDYAYDAFGRQVLRDDGSTIRPVHYGDLSDLPIFDTDAEGELTMSYVQGPEGLVEQRSGEATSFPLRDAHGDITTLVDGEGEVASRQTYDPWGDQLEGPSLEMGWLGAQQRRGDPATRLAQMGARPYSPTLGSFMTEDPILGYVGISPTLNRYAYAWDNPLLYYDLNGRSVLGDVGGAIGSTWNGTGGRAWDETAGARDFVGVAGDGNGGWLGEAPDFVSDRTRDFVKQINFSTTEFIVNSSGIIIGYGICAAAGAAATAVGTPVAGTAAVATCVTSDVISTAGTVQDIFDEDNSIWTDELYE